jgi:hypothetical protein
MVHLHTWSRTMPDPKVHSASALSSRSLVVAPANYMGVSPGKSRKLIAPAPLKLPGIDRHVYDREALNAAMSARAMRHGAA